MKKEYIDKRDRISTNKVYIVTSGKYSDYHIEAVFASYEEAKNYLKKHDYDFGIEAKHIEEWMIGENYLKELYWKVDIEAKCTLSFSVTDILAKTEEVYGYAIRDCIGTRWFHESSSLSMPAFNLMMIIPKRHFTTKQDVEDHYKKVMQNYIAKIKYMVQVESIGIYEAIDLINEQLLCNERDDI